LKAVRESSIEANQHTRHQPHPGAPNPTITTTTPDYHNTPHQPNHHPKQPPAPSNNVDPSTQIQLPPQHRLIRADTHRTSSTHIRSNLPPPTKFLKRQDPKEKESGKGTHYSNSTGRKQRHRRSRKTNTRQRKQTTIVQIRSQHNKNQTGPKEKARRKQNKKQTAKSLKRTQSSGAAANTFSLLTREEKNAVEIKTRRKREKKTHRSR
jgi:hypothetical protein